MPTNKRSSLVVSGINVTPLVDVMLVLLIIFMVSAPLMKEGMKVDLPEVKAKALPTQVENLVVTINKDRSVEINGTRVDNSRLSLILGQIKQQRRIDSVYLQADKAVSYGYAVGIIGAIKMAGFTKVGLVTKPPGHRRTRHKR